MTLWCKDDTPVRGDDTVRGDDGEYRLRYTAALLEVFMQEYILFLQRHEGLSLAFCGVLLILFILETFRARASSGQLTPLQVTNSLNHDNALVVDLRAPALFSAGHIIGATSLPIPEFKAKAKKLIAHKNRPLILVCDKGLDARKYAEELKAEGYNALTLSGGMASWMGADLPLVKGDK
jgi:rhodanese-related sulfurtransferase